MTVRSAEIGAFVPLLDRPQALAHVSEYFEPESRVLGELVDYGTHLIPRCWSSSGKTRTDVVVLVVLLKQVVALLDGAHVLITAGAISPAQLQLRAIFEASVYLSWLMRRETDRRARAYYVANLRKHRLWSLRGTKGSAEAKALKADFRQLSLPATEIRQAEVSAALASVESALREPGLRQMNAAFDRRRGRRAYDPDWYAVLFPRKHKASLYTLAKQVGRRAEYRLMYEQGSEMMHSSRMEPHIRQTGSTMHMRTLRDLSELPLVTQLLIGQGIFAYRLILARYRPTEAENFARKYATEWREAFLSKKRVEYRFIDYTLGR